MARIKILFGLEATGGGALKHLVYLVTRLNTTLFEIDVILSNSRRNDISEEIGKMQKSGAKVFIIPIDRKIRLFKDFRVFLKIIMSIKKRKYDIVHSHSSKAGGLFRLAAGICNVTSIYYTPHCFFFQGKSGITQRFYIITEKLLAKLTSGIIVSEGEQREALKYNITSASKIINVNNAIDFDEYVTCKEATSIKTHYNIPEGVFIAGAIGRLVPQKNWKTFVLAAEEVLKIYPNTIFLIVGEGEQYSFLQKRLKNMGLDKKIIMIGYVKEINKIYGIIDVLINTSISEGLPYVFLEAMRYNKPIIATNTGNCTIVINEKNGFVSPVNDHLTIAGKIALLIENKKLANQMGKDGHEWLIQKFSFELFIKKHEELYKNGLN